MDNYTSSRTDSLDNRTCCNSKTNLTANCSNSLKTPTHKRHTRSPIMVPLDYDIKKLPKVEKFVDIDKEPGELQDLIGALTPTEGSWESYKDFRNDYNRTKQRNIEHPRGYYSTPSEKINFTGGYAVKEHDDESMDVGDNIEKWKGEPVGVDMTGDGSEKDLTREEEGEKNDEEVGGDNDDDSKENEGEEEEVDLSDQFEDDKLEPPEFRDKFYKTKPYYKYLKYPQDAVAAASTENEKTPEVVNKDKDVQNITISYKPLNETKDVGFYRSPPLQAPLYNRPQPQFTRPYNDGGGGMYVFRKRSPFERNTRKIVLVNSPRKPKIIIRSGSCNGCMMPRNVIPVRKVGVPMYYYPKPPSHRFRQVYPPPKYYNKPLYSSQPFPGDPRFLPGEYRDNRFMTSAEFKGRFSNPGDFRGGGGSKFINSGDLKTIIDQNLQTSVAPPVGDPPKTIPNLSEPQKESQTRRQRHNPSVVIEDADPVRKEIHIVRDTPGGYDDTVIYHEKKYVPTDLEISASEAYRPDPFREVEDEYSERVERLNDLIDRETDRTSREIDREYDYWDDH
ncbi:hypothetical protein LSTR_LSTR011785 [Laodelphax striatellus]|uniref:Uncharacterized protein n=1 Tax=Laodelphax striatellus TaxID=195883 RepID=A0A482XK55_LAOST|nr:hypothetical protein LSTR_LSTR011785 [Laodelphax striatellus]